MSTPTTSLTARRHAGATISWRAVVLLIFGAVFWDASSLLTAGNSSAYRGVSFTLLRQMPGGMRVYGIALAIIFITTVIGYGRSDKAPRDLMLRAGLATLAAWYVGWTFAICWSWIVHWQAAGIGGLGRTIAFAGMCWLAAYFAPHDRR